MHVSCGESGNTWMARTEPGHDYYDIEVRMMVLIDFMMVILLRLRIVIDGLVSLVQIAWAIRSTKGDGLKAKAAAALQDPHVHRIRLRLLRAFLPNLVLSKQLVAAYPNTERRSSRVTRTSSKSSTVTADFEVVYEPKMRGITGGKNFFLGMQRHRALRA